MQAIGCNCIYEVTGIDVFTMEEEQPGIFHHGPTDEMHERLDAVIATSGGRLPWTGEYPGEDACREFDFWCFWDDDAKRWVRCDRSHPGATGDLNRLPVYASWDKIGRRWILNADRLGVAREA